MAKPLTLPHKLEYFGTKLVDNMADLPASLVAHKEHVTITQGRN
ncbi:MAG: hypothetical protein O7F73_20050 [Gammaproteobacteria bacterium]|nr:hypothetical protein [Gammaproteobacteria bacterium]